MSRPPVPADENLPEVVPDSSPQALTSRDAYLAHGHLGEKDPKYVAETAPNPEERDLKYAAVEGDAPPGSPGLVKGEDGVWRPAAPVSALSPTDTYAVTPDGTQGGPGAAGAAAEEGRAGEGPAKGAKVCGLKRRTFWIVLGVAIVVVLAAIGGGVGGGLSSRNSSSSGADKGKAENEDKDKDEPDDENFLNNGTVPERGFAFQAFSHADYGGEAGDILTSEGFHDLGFKLLSYVWEPNDTGCCVSFCRNSSVSDNFWCQPRMRDRIEAEEGFPRMGIICGNAIDTFADEQRCSDEDEEEEE